MTSEWFLVDQQNMCKWWKLCYCPTVLQEILQKLCYVQEI